MKSLGNSAVFFSAPKDVTDVVQTSFEFRIVGAQVGHKVWLDVRFEEVREPESHPLVKLVFVELTKWRKPVFKIDGFGFNVEVEILGEGFFDEPKELGPAGKVWSNFSFGPPFLVGERTAKPASAAEFVVLKVLKNRGELFGICPSAGLGSENEETFKSTDVRFFELYGRSIPLLVAKFSFLLIEPSDFFGTQLDTSGL